MIIAIKHKKTWAQRIDELKQFKAKHGHCNVPSIYPENPSLGKFVVNIRYKKKKPDTTIKIEQIQELEALGFEWGSKSLINQKKTWSQRIEELKQFKAKHGHCNVPIKYLENPSLGNFVLKVRQQRNGNRGPALTVNQIQELEALGFEWQLIHIKEDVIWPQRIDELKQFKAKYGHCNVPTKWLANPELGKFVSNARYRKKNPNKPLKIEQIKELENLGFEWERRKTKT